MIGRQVLDAAFPLLQIGPDFPRPRLALPHASALAWTVGYLASTAVWLWVCFWGGAEMLEGHWLANLLHRGASSWESESIKLVGWLILFVTTVWYVIGLFHPDLRIPL